MSDQVQLSKGEERTLLPIWQSIKLQSVVDESLDQIRSIKFKEENSSQSCMPSITQPTQPPKNPSTLPLVNRCEALKGILKERVCTISNKSLYPDRIGPHPIYVSSDSSSNIKRVVVDLRQELGEAIKNWLALRRKRLGCRFNRVGIKYNKYSLQFKIQIANKIKQELKNDQKGRGLRYFIVKQANELKIHPKNITRWFEAKDLKNLEGGRKAKFPLLEFHLSKFIELNPTAKRKDIMREAKRILFDTQQGEINDFNFSKGWYQRFRIRLRQEKVKRSIRDMMLPDADVKANDSKQDLKEFSMINNQSVEEHAGHKKNQRGKEFEQQK